MLLLSQLIGQPVRDAGGEKIAALADLVGRWQGGRHLLVGGLVARVGSRRFYLSWEGVAQMSREGVRLSSYRVDFRQFEVRPGEITLAGEVLDRRLIDIRHRKVIRVNDIALVEVSGRLVVTAVDIGLPALLRRIGPRPLSGAFSSTALVDWEEVEMLPAEEETGIKRTFPRLAKLHPVEVAHIVDELPHRHGADIVESLGDEDAAEVMSEIAEENQAGVLMSIDAERAAHILEEMEPDDAADLLAKLSPEEAGQLLHRMEAEEAQDVRTLMEYREGTAGGLMTSRFVTVPQGWTAAEALGLLRRAEELPDTLTHLLVVDEQGSDRLMGMVSLLEVVLAEPTTRLRALVSEELPAVNPDASTSEVARRMAEYNLAVLPVVDQEKRVLGIVAVDDIVEEMLPERWRRRLPRFFG